MHHFPVSVIYNQVKGMCLVECKNVGQNYPRRQMNVQMNFTSRPVVWALDAFSRDFEIHARTAHALRAQAPESAIHPVYVLSDAVFSARGYSSFLRAALKPRAHRNLEAVLDHEFLIPLRRAGVLQTPRVLVEPSADASVCTNRLLRYACRIGADLIGIGTSGRSSVSRWFAGSFSETLIGESSLPLLVTGPKQIRHSAPTRALLLPTDFQPSDRPAFESVLRFAVRKKLPLYFVRHGFQTSELLIRNGSYLLGGGWASVDALSIDDEEGPANEADEWRRLAENLGVHVTMTADGFGDAASETILNIAHTLDNPLIVLLKHRPSDQRGWLPAGLARDLIRASPYPIYISGQIDEGPLEKPFAHS
jgi:nucleotide-binding universal stress UspA family protein